MSNLSKTNNKLQYACTECGGVSPKWQGQCPDCMAWNSLTQVAIEKKSAVANRHGFAGSAVYDVITKLEDITAQKITRFPTGISELDRVLGGGLVPGSVILAGGDPGIGKSTLLLQTICELSEPEQALYVTGEESLEQVSLRAERLGFEKAPINLLAQTQVETIIRLSKEAKPKIMVIDSVQTMFTELVPSAPGSISQVRESAALLVRFAKAEGIVLFLVGHVNKEGSIAGPRILEHMVDTVLYFEGQKDNRFRILRSIKNRFGAVNELGIFAMTDKGLKGVANPSAIFLTNFGQSVSGSTVLAAWEGTRPMLIEAQALVDDSHGEVPRRVAVGFDLNRLALLLAVLSRHGRVSMYQKDVFLNIVGGVKITETGADLAILAAIYSSFKNIKIPRDLLIFGEIGLGGEIRPVQGGQERIIEAQTQGFAKVIVPKANAPKSSKDFSVKIHPVTKLSEVLELLG